MKKDWWKRRGSPKNHWGEGLQKKQYYKSHGESMEKIQPFGAGCPKNSGLVGEGSTRIFWYFGNFDPISPSTINNKSLIELWPYYSLIFVTALFLNISYSFVSQMLKNIKCKSGTSFDTDDLERHFPNFVYVLRDFTLDLEINGRTVTADQYLEHFLEGKGSASKSCSRNDLIK